MARALPLLFLGIAGATAFSVLAGRTVAPAGAGNTRLPTEGRQETLTRGQDDQLAGARPALEILASHLGVPQDAWQLAQDAHDTAEGLRHVAGATLAQTEAERLAAELGPPLDEGRLLRDMKRLAILSAPELKGPAAARRQELIDELARQHETHGLLAAVKERLRLKKTDLKIVVVTMPDYVDSYSAWFFDRNLDGVQRAAGATSYVLDRFSLPDWDPDAQSGTPRGERHQSEPGVILFRHAYLDRLLLVLMPLETATAGIHKNAFLSAAALANALAPGERLRVLGPSFSGSRLSLRLAIQSALDSGLVPTGLAKPAVLVRSGSATNPGNKELLERRYCASAEPGASCTTPLVEFQATTVTDDDTLEALQHFLGTIEPAWGKGSDMAILYEANTTFGYQFSRSDKPEQGCSTAPGRGNFFPCAVRLTYPLHISRLRTQAREKGPAGRVAFGGGPGTVSFRLDDPTTPQDQLPSVRPEATAAIVQTTLATILDTLERSRLRAVGLLGTDDRDKIFLAEHISYHCPNVQLFTIEGGLAFLHAETRAFMRGTVVAASYPLFSATQLGPRSTTPLHQFQGVGAEGIYNALLTLLDERQSVENGRLLDYATKDCGVDPPQATSNGWQCGPGVWISVIGRNAIWPMRRYGLTAANKDYTWRPAVMPRGQSAESGFRLQPVALRLEEPSRSSAGTHAGLPTSSPEVEASLQAPGAPQWPASALLIFGFVVAAAFLHALGLLALAWILGFGGRWRSVSAIGAAALWLESRLRRHAPWLEPPDLCAARWTRGVPTPDSGGAPPESPAGREAVRVAARNEALRQEYWISLLACAGGLLAVISWLSHMAATGLDTAAGSGGPAAFGFLTPVRAGLGTAFVAGAAATLWPTRARRQAGLLPLIVLRCLPVFLGFGALFALDQVLSSDVWGTPEAAFNALRLAEVRSFVSPTVPVLALSVAVYLWGLWNLWRVHEQAVEFGPGAGVIELLRSDQPAAAKRFSRLLDAPELAIGLPAAAILGVLVVLEASAAVRLGFHMYSADGKWMAWLLLAGTALVSFLVCHALAHGLRQGRTLLDGLRGLGLAPIGRAFAGLGVEPELWQLSAGLPRAREAYVLVQQVRATVTAFEEARSSVPRDAVAAPEPRREPPPERTLAPGVRKTEKVPRPVAEPGVEPDIPDRNLAQQLKVRPADIVELRWGPTSAAIPATEEEEKRPLHASSAWREIGRWSEHLVRLLSRGPWPGRARSVTAAEPKKDESTGGAEAHWRAAETLLALQVAFSVRFALVRLMSVFALAVTGLLLLLCAHLFYSFQSRAFWLGVDWMLLGFATAIILYFLVRLERSTVLSHLWRSEPGKLNWKDQLVHRILVYGAIPVITAFVSFFPEVGTALFSWLEPVQKSLP